MLGYKCLIPRTSETDGQVVGVVYGIINEDVMETKKYRIEEIICDMLHKVTPFAAKAGTTDLLSKESN